MTQASTMRDLVKSAMTLPWAISMFGVQQFTNLMGPPSSERMADAAAAFDEVSDVTAERLDGWLKQTYKVGTGVQHAFVDLMMLRAPEFDQSTLMHMAAEMQDGPVFQAVVKYGLPPVGWLDSFLVSLQDSPALVQEFANKLHIITLVTHVHGELGLDANTVDPLPVLVDKVAAMPTFPRVWATEGLGAWFGDRAMAKAAGGADPTGLLRDADCASLPPWSLTMLHAGIGMAFAKAILAKLEPTSSTESIRAGIARFVKLCRDSARPGYAGAALESMGMLPSANAPWRVIRRLDQEAPHDLARRNILSGIGWALSVVNMRQPIVMEAFLRHHAALVGADDAFTNGVASSLMMRYDTTREDLHVSAYIHYEPVDAEVASAWRALIAAPCELALSETYGKLTRTASLEQLFHYRPAAS